MQSQNKQLIISLDDLFEGNDNWSVFESLANEFPGFKATFFVITGHCRESFLKRIRQPWSQLVFHSWEHSGCWLNWSKEEAKEWLLKFQDYGFEKGFKAPGWRLTKNIEDACKELGFWICSAPTVKVSTTQYWYTYPKEGLYEYDDYSEYYDHIQHKHYDGKEWIDDNHVFFENIEKLRRYCQSNKPNFKFISEMLKTQ